MTSRPFAPLAFLGLLSGCFLDSDPADDIERILVSAVGDTLRGLNRTYGFRAFALDRAGDRIEGVTFTWQSSNQAVLRVDQDGRAQTLAVGSSTVSAAAGKVTGETVVLVSDRAGIVTTGKGPACAIDDQGYAHCWGYWGGLTGSKLVPERLSDSLLFHSVTAGWDPHACGLTTGGEAYCWGQNTAGVIGDSTLEARPRPTPVKGGLLFRFLRSTAAHVCGITFTGGTYCWGWNRYGQLGTQVTDQCGFGPCSKVPVKVETDRRFRTLALTVQLSCGMEQDGALYCWGQATSSPPIVTTPTAMHAGFQFDYVAGNPAGQCGLGKDGVTYCWSTAAGLGSPSSIGGPDLDFLGETAGGHFCGLDKDGKAYCWGSNVLGQLGNGTFRNSNVPVPVAGDLRFTTISGGDQHTCAMTVQSQVYCWGFNAGGILGIGSREGDGVPGCPDGNYCWTTPKLTLFKP